MAWSVEDASRLRAWEKANPERRKETQFKRRVRLKHLIFEHYGSKCACYGESNLTFLSIDHIDNDGAAHRKHIGSGGKLYLWIRRNNYPANLRLLCFNCNMGRQINKGSCPHNNGI